MKKIIRNGCLIFLLLLVCATVACQGLAKRETENESEKMNEPCYELIVLSPVTGDLAYIGEYARWTVGYAEQVINDAGGIGGVPVRISVLDTRFDANHVKSLKKELTDQRILFGPIDAPGTVAVEELVREEKLPNVASYSYESIRNQAAPYGISYMSDSTEGEIQAVKLWQQLNSDIKKVVVFADPQETSQMECALLLKEQLPQMGMELLNIVEVEAGTDGVMKAVVKALNGGAEGYISLIRAENHGMLVTELRKRGVTEGRRMTASFAGFEMDILTDSLNALEDTYIWNKFDAKYSGADWQKLMRAYQQDHDGKVPDSNVVPDMYNAVMAWKQCMEELQLGDTVKDLETEREQIAAWFYNSPKIQGIQGEFQWVEGKKVSSVYYFQFSEEGVVSI